MLTGGWSLTQLEVDSDITRFLPPSGNARDEAIARALVSSELSRTLTVTIEAPDEDSAARAARELADRLRTHADLAWVRTGADEEFERAFYDLYFPRRFEFAASSSATATAMTQAAEIRRRARRLRDQLASPTSPLLGQLAPSDPWMLFVDHLRRLQRRHGSLRSHRNAFVTEDGGYGVVLMASKTSPFDLPASRRILRDLRQAFNELSSESNPPGSNGVEIEMEVASVHRFVVRSADATQADILRVTGAGALIAVLFLLVVFRSPWLVFVGHLPLVGGVAGGLTACVLVVGRIHGLTLAFGATLIGVAVDYVSHLLNHHVLDPAPSGPLGTARRIAPAMILGGATTIAGVAGLGWTGHRAIQEMALFTASGIVVALLASLVLLPPLLPRKPQASRVHRHLAATLERGFERYRQHRRVGTALLILAIAVSVTGLLKAEFADDHRALSNLDPDLVAEEERVRERVAKVDQSQVIVAQGASLDEALEVNDEVYEALSALEQSGKVERFRSLHDLVRAETTQREVKDALRDAGSSGTMEMYAAEGFDPEALADFTEALNTPARPLRLEHLTGTPFQPLIHPFLLDNAEAPTVVTFVGGVRDHNELRDRIAQIPGAFVFDQREFATNGYRRFRERTTELLLVGLGAVLVLLFVRYRRLGSTLAAFAPAALAGGLALAVTSLLGEPLTFIHLVTLLVVLSMGVDYGIFLVESDRGSDVGPTLTSLTVACGSTVASFGALALSAQPAMHAMGLITAVGVLASLVLAPTVWALTLGRR